MHYLCQRYLKDAVLARGVAIAIGRTCSLIVYGYTSTSVSSGR